MLCCVFLPVTLFSHVFAPAPEFTPVSAPAHDQGHVMSLETLSISLVLSTGTILVGLVNRGSSEAGCFSCHGHGGHSQLLASLVASMEAVPESSRLGSSRPKIIPMYWREGATRHGSPDCLSCHGSLSSHFCHSLSGLSILLWLPGLPDPPWHPSLPDPPWVPLWRPAVPWRSVLRGLQCIHSPLPSRCYMACGRGFQEGEYCQACSCRVVFCSPLSCSSVCFAHIWLCSCPHCFIIRSLVTTCVVLIIRLVQIT